MRQIFAVAVVAFSAAAIASGQEQSAIRDPKSIAEQVIRKLDNERIQAQIHADVAALERIYADDFIGDIREYVDAELALAPPQLPDGQYELHFDGRMLRVKNAAGKWCFAELEGYHPHCERLQIEPSRLVADIPLDGLLPKGSLPRSTIHHSRWSIHAPAPATSSSPWSRGTFHPCHRGGPAFEFSNAVPNLSQPTRLSVIPDCGYVVASSVDSRSACSLIFRRNARNSFRISTNSCASFRDCLRESSKLLVLVCVLPFILF